MPKAPVGYTKNKVTELAEVLSFDLADLKSEPCTAGVHANCSGSSSTLMRPHPMNSEAASKRREETEHVALYSQPFPCLCSCHEIFTLVGWAQRG